jgi:hypothetical protein
MLSLINKDEQATASTVEATAAASSSKQAAAMEASSNLLRATQFAAETSPMVKRRNVSMERKMSRDVSGERGEVGGGAMRRLSREAAIGDSQFAATATATTSSSRRVSSSMEQQHVAVATASSSQQQATRVATAASSTHLHAEDSGMGGVRIY